MKNLAAELAKLKAAHQYRRRKISHSPQAPLMQIDGQSVLSFCSNDYLGLANHPAVVTRFQQASNHYGVGSGAAHLINGHSAEHHALEEEIADFTGRERALLFSTGYMANLGVMNALIGRADSLFQDRLNHASLIDGARLSQAQFIRYRHNDCEHLQQRLAQRQQGETLIVSDGIFSMDGDAAPASELAAIAKQHQAWLMLDDAHGFGVLGKNGGGLCEHQGLTSNEVPILVGTLGKAFGTAGAFVAGSEALIEYLIQTARSYVYTTAMPAAIAAATRESLKRLQQETWRRDKLQQHIAFFRQQASSLGLELLPSQTAIQPIVFGDNEKTLQAAQTLLEQQILVTAIRPPTVPKGSARLRITFSADHAHEQLERLLDALAKL